MHDTFQLEQVIRQLSLSLKQNKIKQNESQGLPQRLLVIDGDWRTIYIAADNVEKIEEGGELRGYFRHMECQDGCGNISITFYVKKDGVCQEFTVVGVKDEARGVYVAEYAPPRMSLKALPLLPAHLPILLASALQQILIPTLQGRGESLQNCSAQSQGRWDECVGS
ncbi:Odorant-binding protein [Fukomys damarensis]|uniref:Odorant-binding protein n=1 Tax=Fukomys damarensis TaxID=885580 RepID=A0A091E319_FUKDA|nr:Odorant-binding protein [Fukomys damarensis]